MSEMCDLLTIFKNKFRKIENLTKKCVNLEGAIKFNKNCLNNRIYPVHVKIKLRGRAVTDNKDVEEFQDKELANEIKRKSKYLKETQEELKILKEGLKNSIDETLYSQFEQKMSEVYI